MTQGTDKQTNESQKRKKESNPKELHQCPTCKFQTKRPYNLKTHMLTHGTIRAFHCKLCSCSFKVKRHLSRHIEAVHEKKKPFKCTVADCHYSSPYKWNLQKHLQKTHN